MNYDDVEHTAHQLSIPLGEWLNPQPEDLPDEGQDGEEKP